MGWNTRKVLDFLEFALNEISDLCWRNSGVTVLRKFDAKKKVITAKLLPENDFFRLVQSSLSRSKYKLKQPTNKFLKFHITLENMSQEIITAKPSRTSRDEETIQLAEDVRSDSKTSQDSQTYTISISLSRMRDRMLLCISFLVFIIRWSL